MRRLTLSLLLVVLLAVIGIGWAIDQWYNLQLPEKEDPAITAYKDIGQELALLVDARQDGTLAYDWKNLSHMNPQFVAAENFLLPPDIAENFQHGEPLLLESGDGLSLHYYLPHHQQVLSLTLPDELRSEREFDALRWMLTLLFYGGIILVVFLWLTPLLRRLAQLRKTAEAFGHGDLHVRIKEDSQSYLYTIEQEFNRMAQRIEQLVADNKLLSRGLSHDLRTPLARLRFGLGVLEESVLSEGQQQHLAHLNRDLEAMEALVEVLLNYARLEQATITFTTQELSIASFVSELVRDYYKDNVEVENHMVDRSGVIQANPEYVSMLIHNLVQNSLRYGRGRIVISLAQINNEVYFSIEDNGSGIPVDERKNVLQPFYRGNPSHSSHGYGLGLAIVERITRRHKARLVLGESERLGGLQVQVIFKAG